MFKTVMDFLDSCLTWVMQNPGYCLLGVLGFFIVGAILEKIFPCIWGHAEEGVKRILYDSDSIQTSTIDFYCRRCGKKC